MARCLLFALPYAGGAAHAIFTAWRRQLGDDITLHALEYPGHGSRMAEPFAPTIAALATDLLSQVAPLMQARPYAIYAHSMGALVATELLAQLNARRLPAPEAVFLSGRNPPHHRYPRCLHQLSDADFLAEIQQLGGTSAAFFAEQQVVGTFLPILRADYRLCESWPVQQPQWLTSADLTFFYSDADPLVDAAVAQQWQLYSSGNFYWHAFAGPHFFIQQQYPQLCQLIRRQLGLGALDVAKEPNVPVPQHSAPSATGGGGC